MVSAAGTAGKHLEALYFALRLGDVVVECRVVFINPHTRRSGPAVSAPGRGHHHRLDKQFRM